VKRPAALRLVWVLWWGRVLPKETAGGRQDPPCRHAIVVGIIRQSKGLLLFLLPLSLLCHQRACPFRWFGMQSISSVHRRPMNEME